jgi:hypothetical protein
MFEPTETGSVPAERAARRGRRADDVTTDPAPADVTVAPKGRRRAAAPATPPAQVTPAQQPSQPPPQVPDGVGAAAARARARATAAASQNQTGWGSTFNPPPFSPDPPRVAGPAAPGAPDADFDYDPFLAAVDDVAAPAAAASPSPVLHDDPLPGITEADFVTDPFDPRFRPKPQRGAPQQAPQRPSLAGSAEDALRRALATARSGGWNAVTRHPRIATAVGGLGALAAWQMIPRAAPENYIPADAEEGAVPMSAPVQAAPAQAAPVADEASARQVIREAMRARSEAVMRAAARSRIGMPGTMYQD